MCCSENALVVLTDTGKVYFIYYNSETTCPQLVEGLLINILLSTKTNYKIFLAGLKDKEVIKIASHPEGKHYLALTREKDVFSWGNGDGGRLGMIVFEKYYIVGDLHKSIVCKKNWKRNCLCCVSELSLNSIFWNRVLLCYIVSTVLIKFKDALDNYLLVDSLLSGRLDISSDFQLCTN